MTLRQYDPKLVIITVGSIPVSGFADGTFLSIDRNEDAYSLQVGTDGEGTRSKTNNNSGTVTLTLMQSSATNDLLSALHELDRATPAIGGANAGCVPFLVKDMSGRSLYAAEAMWIKKAPAAEFGREAATREWILETDDLRVFHGGN